MRKYLFSFLLSFTILSSFAQDSSSKKGNDLKIISHYHKAYEINGEKIKNLKPFLMRYEEPAKEYKLAKESSTIGIVFLGIGLAEVTTMLLTKSDKTRKVASIYIGIP